MMRHPARVRTWLNAFVVATLVAPTMIAWAYAAPKPIQTVAIVYLDQSVKSRPALSNLEPDPSDAGLQGAMLAIKDNNTTGRFLGQSYTLIDHRATTAEDVLQRFESMLTAGHRLFVLKLPAPTLEKLLPALDRYPDVLLFNAGARDNRLRQQACHPAVLHTLPSRAMLADALAQYLMSRRWRDWFLLVGMEPGDRLFAAALRRAARRFGGKIVKEKHWNGGRDARRTAQAEVPLLTQADEYDVMLVADEQGDFGDFLLYRTWLPRPVAGTQGLVPTTWHKTVEQWGATQLQRRFKKASGRSMIATDYAAWVAVRAIGEAVTRTGTVLPGAIADYVRGQEFEVAAFKGRKLSFRPWSGQMRQPIPLAAARSQVSVSPQAGYLHPTSELDTLGFDKPESECKTK